VEDAEFLSVREGDEDNIDESNEDAWDRGGDSIDESPFSRFSMRDVEHEDTSDEDDDGEDGNKDNNPNLSYVLNRVCSVVGEVVRRVVAADNDKDKSDNDG
jgi:hypothetical protein